MEDSQEQVWGRIHFFALKWPSEILFLTENNPSSPTKAQKDIILKNNLAVTSIWWPN